MAYKFDYHFENLSTYKIEFLTLAASTNRETSKKYMKPMRVRIVGIYVGETDEHINFAMGISEDDCDFNKIMIPKCSLVKSPIKMTRDYK